MIQESNSHYCLLLSGCYLTGHPPSNLKKHGPDVHLDHSVKLQTRPQHLKAFMVSHLVKWWTEQTVLLQSVKQHTISTKSIAHLGHQSSPYRMKSSAQHGMSSLPGGFSSMSFHFSRYSISLSQFSRLSRSISISILQRKGINLSLVQMLDRNKGHLSMVSLDLIL